ncbi:Aquaporin-2 [Saitozyma sp. JCM 24511]|nr:Aquaporin-2 [Saitozyma sp. JCM 24511]
MSLPSHRKDLDTPRGKSRRGPFNWHLRRPEQGPVALAIKNHFIAMVGEYVGTVLFLMFAFGGTNVALIPTTSVTGSTTAGQDGSAAATVNTSNLLFIALCFGFSLMVTAWIFFRVSGGLFNPAVSLGMVLVGALTPLRGALLSFVQILGAITGAAIIQAVTPGTLNVQTTLGGGTSIAQGLFIEMFLTSLLMLAILLLAAEKHKATYIAPVGIGLALFVAELFGVYYTGGSLNPARSFGPAVVLRDFSGYHWIYWVGPGLGATIAAGFYKMLKFLQYETVLGPEADADVVPPPAASSEGATEDPEKNAGVRTLAVTGPGLDDLLTTSLTRDSRQETADLEDRLDRIESFLSQLVESQGIGGSEPRPNRVSNSTFVDEVGSHKTGAKYPTEAEAGTGDRHLTR